MHGNEGRRTTLYLAVATGGSRHFFARYTATNSSKFTTTILPMQAHSCFSFGPGSVSFGGISSLLPAGTQINCATPWPPRESIGRSTFTPHQPTRRSDHTPTFILTENGCRSSACASQALSNVEHGALERRVHLQHARVRAHLTGGRVVGRRVAAVQREVSRTECHEMRIVR
jgi:hypothetical protein